MSSNVAGTVPAPPALAPDFAEIDRIEHRRLRRDRRVVRWSRLVLIVALLLAWELVSRYLVDPFWIGRPSQIGPRLVEWFSTGFIYPHIAATAYSMLAGIFLGGLAGAGLGLLIGTARRTEEILDPVITALYSVPKVALAPLFVLWFGIGFAPKIMLTAATVFFLMFRNTLSGVQSVDRDLLDVVRVLGATPRQMRRLVIWPAATSWIFLGLRLSVPYALIAAVVAEFVVSTEGLGYLIRFAGSSFDTPSVFGALIVLGTAGFAANEAVKFSERMMSPWRREATLRGSE